MQRSEEVGELGKALAAAQAEMAAVPKDADNKFYNSKYAQLSSVVRTGAPVLSKHGLAVTQHPSFDEAGHDVLITWLLHSSGEFMVSSMRLKATKEDPQGLGSAITYARRQAYMAVCGLVADEDDDGNAGSGKSSSKTKAPQPTAKPVEKTRPIASGAQRGMINGRAAEAGLTGQQFADALRSTFGIEPHEYSSDEEALRYVNTQLDRLPADRVDDVLAAIAPQTALETSA